MPFTLRVLPAAAFCQVFAAALLTGRAKARMTD